MCTQNFMPIATAMQPTHARLHYRCGSTVILTPHFDPGILAWIALRYEHDGSATHLTIFNVLLLFYGSVNQNPALFPAVRTADLYFRKFVHQGAL